MAKTHAMPDEIGEALTLREAGYTALAISQRLGISVRTLQPTLRPQGRGKGQSKLRCCAEAARLLADDLAHSIHLREVILAASEQMKAESLADAVQVMRAAAAYSTAIKNTSDIIRRSLQLEVRDETSDELPELVVKELTQAEIDQLQIKEATEEKATSENGLADEAMMQ
jgi:hypothetical protein